MTGPHLTSRVHLIFKTHLDLGFTDLARDVVDRYMSDLIPAALETAARMRENDSSDRFIWTTGSWLIYEYLERASGSGRRLLEAAIEAGDISWHAMPFTVHSELLTPSLFRFGLSLSAVLDRRFGRKTIAAKMTDVPGHTRGIVPLLAEAGVEFLHIGVNEASTVPDVPPIFVWRDADGAGVIVMYHHSYGATMSIPGVPDAISFAHTKDNRGPQDADEVRAIYARHRAEFPRATVSASTLSEYAATLRPIRDSLPVVTSEIGDTWIHGTASDPTKIARYRELARLREEWLERGALRADDPPMSTLSRHLLCVAEHTWGVDDKTFLGDYGHYSQEDFLSVRTSPRFRKMAASWEEQREYVDDAVAALSDSRVAGELRSRMAQLEAVVPSMDELEPLDPRSPSVVTPVFELGFSQSTGAITHLLERRSNTVLADDDHPIGLLGFQTFSTEDYERFLDEYLTERFDWARADFGKPGLENSGAESGWADLAVRGMWHGADDAGHTVVVELRLQENARRAHGGPEIFYLTVRVPAEGSEIRLDVQWFATEPSRMPQAWWFSFAPRAAHDARWQFRKLGRSIDPRDVVSNGNRRFHAIEDTVSCVGPDQTVTITSLDSPLVAAGEPSLLRFTNRTPDMSSGVHFNLYNNTWGTNFPSWYGDDGRARFFLRTDHSVSK